MVFKLKIQSPKLGNHCIVTMRPAVSDQSLIELDVKEKKLMILRIEGMLYTKKHWDQATERPLSVRRNEPEANT